MDSTLPAAAEGDLRDLARDLRGSGLDAEAARLEAIVARHSGIRPLRTLPHRRVTAPRGGR